MLFEKNNIYLFFLFDFIVYSVLKRLKYLLNLGGFIVK